MHRRSSHPELVATTRRAIAARLAQGHPAMHDVAGTIGINLRTLQRRLAEVGLTYSRLVDDVRFDTARRLLQDRRRTLAAISAALGYADPAHFTRAFARWTGTTPRAYRRREAKRSAMNESPCQASRASRSVV